MDSEKIQKLNIIMNLLKAKKDSIQYYDEVSRFIFEVLNGNFDNYNIIDNRILSKVLNITKMKASKVLRILYLNGLINKNVEKNSYNLISPHKFKTIFFDWVLLKSSEFTNNLSNLFQEKIYPSSFRNLDLGQALELINSRIKNLDLNISIYQESMTSEFTSLTKFNEIPKIKRELLNKYISQSVYENFYERHCNLRSRLEKIVDENKDGKLYSINCLKNLFGFIILKQLTELIPKRTVKEIGNEILNIILDGIESFKEFILKNKYLFIIDFNKEQFFGPSWMAGAENILFFKNNAHNPFKLTPIYNYSINFTDKLKSIFCEIFNSLLIPIKKEITPIADSLFRHDLGKYLYEHSLKVINQKLQEIEEL
ncbi:MAG: hypothetical protein ACTSYZ_03695 [Candidatus Helarchaeota archaeon]